jgi:hypothetical protein
MISKQLQYLAGAQSAGLVMGARVPIVLTSRADGAQARIASCALALLLAGHLSGVSRRADGESLSAADAVLTPPLPTPLPAS